MKKAFSTGTILMLTLMLCTGCSCEHEYGEWSVTAEATCHTEGVESRTCTKCQETETRPVAMIEHAMGSWTVTKAPTCTATGVETKQCKNCAYAESRDAAIVPHEMGDWSASIEATCTKGGEETRSCTVCGKQENRQTEAKGHSFSAWVITTEATCTNDGKEESRCSNCTEIQTKPINKYGHNWGTATCEAAKTCFRCGKTDGTPLGHKSNERGFCQTCGDLLASSPVVGAYKFVCVADEYNEVSFVGSGSCTIKAGGSITMKYSTTTVTGQLVDGGVSDKGYHFYKFVADKYAWSPASVLFDTSRKQIMISISDDAKFIYGK